MKFFRYILLGFHLIIFCPFLKSQEEYTHAFQFLSKTLEQPLEPSSFKKAVYATEMAYDPMLDTNDMNNRIMALKKLTTLNKIANPIIYRGKDYEKVNIYASLFKILTDTTLVIAPNGDDTLTMYPFIYDFEDIFGTRHWEKMFVSKLLYQQNGNCHSLPYLYKIICNEFGVSCYLALAPNHIYIKHRADKGGMYNTELTSGTFPMDAWLMASGYISLEAVQKGTFLDTLSEMESIALCVIDLAHGFNHKYPDNDGKFVIECCDLALKYFPNYVNAILLKAETRLKQLQKMQKRYGYEYLREVTVYPEAKILWNEMNNLYMQLYKLGYRQMPEQMYVEWLTSLKTEKEKYTNKNAPGATKE
jgi:hypothetical protein